MPEPGQVIKWHARLEWWRRIGLDAALDVIDDTIKWRPIIAFSLCSVATLVTFVVLCFDVVPGGASAWTTSTSWGLPSPSGTCEYENPERMIHQMFTAISASSYAFVGWMIALLTFFDSQIVYERFRARRRQLPSRPFCKGPDGNEHIKVTAIATLWPLGEYSHHHPNFVSVDPEYLRGNIPALLRRKPIWGLLFALSTCFLAVGSYLSHASNTELGDRLETTAWFSLALSFATYTVARTIVDGASPRVNMCGWFEFLGVMWRVPCDSKVRNRASRVTSYLFVASVIAVVIIAFFLFDVRTPFVSWTAYSVLAGVAFCALSLHYLGRKEEVDTWYELALFGAILFGAGVLFRHYDTAGLCVDPRGYFQAHALWHCLSACGVAFTYLALRSDMWLYDLVHAKEERRHEAMDEAYRVPGMDLDEIQQQQTTEREEALRRRTLERGGDNSNGSARRRTLEEQAGTGNRPRTLDREDSNTEGSTRRRTLDREDSGNSHASSRRLEQLRAQARDRASKKTQKTLDSDSELGDSSIGAAYWTCPECAFEDNELAYLVCERCQAERPPLDEFVPMSVVQGYL